MGLDINAYGGCKLTDIDPDDWEHPEPRTVRPYVNPHFPAQADGIVGDRWYQYGTATSFTAGSYEGYGLWRRGLARLGGYEAEEAWDGRVTSGPFYELVNFADNEGVIGPVTSAKLARDFADNEDAAVAIMDDHDLKRYRNWRIAFETAREDGLVEFR